MIPNRVGFETLVRREILRFFVVFTQTIVPPLVSSTLFIFVFGFSLGRNLEIQIGAYSYLQFLVPGLVVMQLIEGSYGNTSSSLFIARWHNHIQEILLSPLTYYEMVLGLLVGGITRGLLVASGVYGISLLFTQFVWHNVAVAVYFMLVVSVIFSLLGLLVGLWATGFEKLSIWTTFVISPLIYFGGVFHTIDMVPPALQMVTKLNPIFYLVSGLRYGMLGIADANLAVGMVLSAVLAMGLFFLVVWLFKIGYRLRT